MDWPAVALGTVSLKVVPPLLSLDPPQVRDGELVVRDAVDQALFVIGECWRVEKGTGKGAHVVMSLGVGAKVARVVVVFRRGRKPDAVQVGPELSREASDAAVIVVPRDEPLHLHSHPPAVRGSSLRPQQLG